MLEHRSVQKSRNLTPGAPYLDLVHSTPESSSPKLHRKDGGILAVHQMVLVLESGPLPFKTCPLVASKSSDLSSTRSRNIINQRTFIDSSITGCGEPLLHSQSYENGSFALHPPQRLPCCSELTIAGTRNPSSTFGSTSPSINACAMVL